MDHGGPCEFVVKDEGSKVKVTPYNNVRCVVDSNVVIDDRCSRERNIILFHETILVIDTK